MAATFTVSGISVPIIVYDATDVSSFQKSEQVLKDIQKSLATINSEMSKKSSSSMFDKFGETGTQIKAIMGTVDGAIRSLTNLRWTMVNMAFFGTFVAGLASPFVEATKSAMEFERELVRIQSVTGQSAASSSNIILGARKGTPFDRMEVAAGYLEFTKAGFSAEEATKSLVPIINLAQVAQIGLGEASTRVAQTIKQFGLAASDSGRIVDTLSSVADNTRANVDGLAVALSYVGTIAGEAGATMEDTIVALGMLADQGMDASKSGTVLRQIYSEMLDPSEKAKKKMLELGVSFLDASGKSKPMLQVMNELRISLQSLSTGERQQALAEMFDVRSLTGVEAYLSTLDKTDGLLGDINASATEAGKAQIKAFMDSNTIASTLTSTLNDLSDTLMKQLAISPEATKLASNEIKKLNAELDETIPKMKAIWTSPVVDQNNPFDRFANILVNGLPKGGPLVTTKSPFESFGLKDNNTRADEYNKKIQDKLDLEKKYEDTVANISKMQNEQVKGANDLLAIYSQLPGVMSLIANASSPEENKRLDELKQARKEQEFYAASVIKNAEDMAAAKASGNKDQEVLSTTYMNDALQLRIFYEKEIVRLAGDKTDIDSIAAKTIAYNALNTRVEILRTSLAGIKDKSKSVFDKLLPDSKDFETSTALSSILPTKQVSESISIAKQLGLATNENIRNIGNELITTSDYIAKVQEEEREIVKLTKQKEELNLVIKSQRRELEIEKNTLAELNKTLSETEKKISNLEKARFTGETRIMNILDKGNTWLQKQELASLGVADAQTFINEALDRTNDEYETMFGQISKVNAEMKSGENAFKAWQTTIQEEIKAEVAAGQSLGADVTERTKIRQTELLGIGKISGTDNATTQLDEYMNKLKLANEIVYGSQHNEVSNAQRMNEDVTNGVYNNAQQVIAKLQEEYEIRSNVISKIVDQESVIAETEKSLNTNLQALDIVINTITSSKTDIDNFVIAMKGIYDKLIIWSEDITTKAALKTGKEQLTSGTLISKISPSLIKETTVADLLPATYPKLNTKNPENNITVHINGDITNEQDATKYGYAAARAITLKLGT